MWNPKQHLYPYQATDLDVMAESNVLLAYEMGLGKTVTTIATIERLRERGEIDGPGVVVTPASLKWQWAREIEKFSSGKAVVINGSATRRQSQYFDAILWADYVIMTYDAFVRDWRDHCNINAFLVLDEATAIKSWKSKRTKHFKKTRDHYGVRIALSGTPIENGNPEELFSILEWVDPEILGTYWPFEKKYIRRNHWGGIEGYRNLQDFHRRVKPYILRRTHNQPEVKDYLPEVRYMEPIRVPMDLGTERAYRKIAADLLSDLDAMAASMSTRTHPDGKMMAKITAARMLLDHPGVLEKSDGDYAKTIKIPTSAGESKVQAVMQYVKDFLDLDPKNKVVVFVSFVEMAHILRAKWNPGAVVFTGSMTAGMRDSAKMQFQKDPDIRVFISTDAGGYGLDLPEANLLINYDQPWTAGLLKQRNARIRRASSEWDYVVVQDFVMADTLEERMLDMVDHKAAVSSAIIDGEGIAEDGSLISDLDSLRSFLDEHRERATIHAS
jgi:SNF2 family DNA or RNA helicase